MAREHARLLTSIWDDEDWLALKSSHQILYLSLFSSPDLSWCGVLPLVPRRLADVSADMSEAKVRVGFGVLECSRFIITDASTAEVLVRTYVRHDGILKQPNVTKAMVRALGRVHSPVLVEAIKTELARELKANPDAAGWRMMRDKFGALYADLKARPLREPITEPFAEPMSNSLPPSPLTLPPTTTEPPFHHSSSSVTRELQARR